MNNVAKGLSVMVVIIGILVLTGWFSRNATLVQVLPAFAPMRFNSALAFVLTGMGILLIHYHRQWISMCCALIVMAIGLLALIENSMSIDFMIDELFMKDYFASKGTRPGQLAPNSALCFFLSGLTLLLMRKWLDNKKKLPVLSVLSAVIVALGIVAFTGYLGGLETAYGWGNLSRMAVHSSLGFILIGVSLFLLAWTKAGSMFPEWIPYPTFIFLFTCSICLWQALNHQSDRQNRKSYDQTAREIKLTIEKQLMIRINALERLAKRWEVRGGIPREEWNKDVEYYIKHQPEFQAIEWVDDTYHVRWIAPLKGNEFAQNLNLAAEAKRRQALEKSRKNYERTMTEPITLVQGGKGILVFIPIEVKSEFDGFILGVYRIGTLIKNILDDKYFSNYYLSLSSSDKRFYSNQEFSHEESKYRSRVEINFLNATWIADITPRENYLNQNSSATSLFILVMGALMSFLVAITLHMARAAREAQGRMQTYLEKLERSNQELDDFAYIVSHDLKEPLRGIQQQSSFLQEDYEKELGEDGAKRIAKVAANCERLAKLLETLMHYSRLGRTEMAVAPVDLDGVLKDILAQLEGYLEENGATVEIPEPLPSVTCDMARVGEVFRNLITNAVKYNDHERKKIIIGFEDCRFQRVFYVMDNGIGIAEEYHENIFKIFKRLHGKNEYQGGTGSGLSIVHRIIQNHHGKIWLKSRPGEGTTFYFTLRGEPS